MDLAPECAGGALFRAHQLLPSPQPCALSWDQVVVHSDTSRVNSATGSLLFEFFRLAATKGGNHLRRWWEMVVGEEEMPA